MTETTSSSELITPENIKKRVLSFFDGVDLKTHTGETDVNHLKITTKPIKALPWTSEVDHRATINGFDVAKYMHQGEDKLAPLETGKVRETSNYVLSGYILGRGIVTVWYSEFDGKEPELKITIPERHGNLRDFDKDDREDVARVLGIEL